ncbi:hypothetical protein H9P43_007252 [Blastocladiella emersonii ATCC 22665]|nr:hypothetical protein H9P43_007252 [Blastocladiella emersonii ATCC 22665]
MPPTPKQKKPATSAAKKKASSAPAAVKPSLRRPASLPTAGSASAAGDAGKLTNFFGASKPATAKGNKPGALRIASSSPTAAASHLASPPASSTSPTRAPAVASSSPKRVLSSPPPAAHQLPTPTSPTAAAADPTTSDARLPSSVAYLASHFRSESDRASAVAQLRAFDLDLRYGPAVGVPRLARWQRAAGRGLAPPADVGRLLSALDAVGQVDPVPAYTAQLGCVYDGYAAVI